MGNPAVSDVESPCTIGKRRLSIPIPPPSWLLPLLLLLIPLLSIDNFFSYHAPGAIGASVQQYYGMNEEQLAALFTIYSAPNIVLVFIGGMLIDRFGLIRTTLGFNACILVGMILFAVTSPSSSFCFAQLLFGRFLLGVGGECLCAAASAMLARWFSGSGLTAAMGCYAAIVQILGSAPAFILLPIMLGRQTQSAVPMSDDATSSTTTDSSTTDGSITNFGNVSLCNWIVVSVCIISMKANLVYALIEKRYGEKYMQPLDGDDDTSKDPVVALGPDGWPLAEGDTPVTPLTPATPAMRAASTMSPRVECIAVESASIIDEHTALLRQAQACAQRKASYTSTSSNPPPYLSPPALTAQTQVPASSFSPLGPLSTLRSLPLLFWLVLLMHCSLSPILYTFTAFGPQMIQQKYALGEEESGTMTSLLYMAFLLAPFLGYVVDRIGRRALIQVVASAIIPLILTLLHTTNITPWILLAALGIAFAVTESNGLAMVAEVAPSSLLGTSYGLVGCGISAALLFEPWLVGRMRTQTGNYDASNLMFIGIATVGWIAACTIFAYDYTHQRIMTQPKHEGGGVGYSPIEDIKDIRSPAAVAPTP